MTSDAQVAELQKIVDKHNTPLSAAGQSFSQSNTVGAPDLSATDEEQVAAWAYQIVQSAINGAVAVSLGNERMIDQSATDSLEATKELARLMGIDFEQELTNRFTEAVSTMSTSEKIETVFSMLRGGISR